MSNNRRSTKKGSSLKAPQGGDLIDLSVVAAQKEVIKKQRAKDRAYFYYGKKGHFANKCPKKEKAVGAASKETPKEEKSAKLVVWSPSKPTEVG